ncbi:hypothetical protein OEZ86_002941 [Tetradesmus obliquus]|nr:hypothetical protein OEZ86_002941 [Tetradesmus obliquus]
MVVTGYFAAMEGIQVLQYLVGNDCASKTNQLLLILGLLHIAFQPFVVNWTLFAPPYPAALSKLAPPFTYPIVHKVVTRLGLAMAGLLVVKTLPAFVALLGAQQLLHDALAPHLPANVVSVLLTNTCGYPEFGCGAQLCSMTGKYHLAWIAPQMGAGYYVPSFFAHFFAMFGPSLLFGSTYHRLLILLLLASGPLMTEWLVWGGGQDVRRLEWPSIWCLFAVAQVAGILGLEVLSNGLVNGSWTLPSMHTSRADDTACADGAADTHRAERAGSAAKKQL